MTEEKMVEALNDGILEIPHYYCRDSDKTMRETAEDIKKMAVMAMKKQIPKKTKHEGCYDSDGAWHEWNGINGRPYELCPNCETNLCCEMPYDKKPKYCKECGQKLDWSDK